jgi:hypothetical protein
VGEKLLTFKPNVVASFVDWLIGSLAGCMIGLSFIVTQAHGQVDNQKID